MRSSVSLHKKRLQALKARIASGIYLETHPTNVLYLTGLHLSRCRLYISRQKAILFVDNRYYEMAKNCAPCEVRPWDFLKTRAEVLFDHAHTSYQGYLELKGHYGAVRGIDNPVAEERAIKDKHEIALIRESARLLMEGYRLLRRRVRPGVTELEIAKAFHVYAHKVGDGVSFEPIVAFGKNTSMPHYTPTQTKLKKNDLVLLDLGIKYEGYCSDMTRTFGPKMETTQHLVDEAKQRVVEAFIPGMTFEDLTKIAREALGSEEKYFVHSLGHGIGLDVHEGPRKGVLEPGMVITIEPGLYYPGEGGVRLEDMYLVTRRGLEKLT